MQTVTTYTNNLFYSCKRLVNHACIQSLPGNEVTSTYYQCHFYPLSMSFLPTIDVISTPYQCHFYPLSMSFLPPMNSSSTPYECHFNPLLMSSHSPMNTTSTPYKYHFNPLSGAENRPQTPLAMTINPTGSSYKLQKKGVIILFLIMICVIGKGQTPINNIYNPNNTSASAFNIFQTDSGFVSSGGMRDSFYFKTNAVVSKYDNAGNQLKFKEFKKDSFASFAGNFSGGAMASCKSGGFALALTQTNNIKYKILLIRLSNNLDTFWTKNIKDDTIFINAKHCIETSDKGFAMLGEKSVFNPSENSLVWFCKTDSMGNILFEKLYDITIGIKGSRWDAGWNICETPDKGFLLGCFTYDNAYQGTGDGIVIKTDSLGNLIWMKNFGGPEGDVGLVTTVCNDGNYMVASSRAYYTGEYNQWWEGKIRLTKINPNGNTLWVKEYFGVIYGMSVTGLRALDDGSFVFGGSKESSVNQGLFDSYLFKVNANGDSIWCKEYFYPVTGNTQVAWNTIYTFNITPENHILACGEVFYNGILPKNIWIFKTDSLGCIVSGCDTLTGIENMQFIKLGQLHIYPNPATTQTTITYLTAERTITLQIYNMLGQVIYEEKLSKGSSQIIINTTGFKPGLYKVVAGESSASLIIN